MRLQGIVTWLAALVAVSGAQALYGAGKEIGRLSARLQNQAVSNGVLDQAQQKRDSNRFDGNADQRARWAGTSGAKENTLGQNEAVLQQRAQAANKNFGQFSNNFGNIAKQIRDEAKRNQYVVKDDAQYKWNDVSSAEGANKANAKKTAFDKGEVLDDNINYAFNKKFDKASAENGGYEEENGRNQKKLNLLDERETDRKLLRGDSEVARTQADSQKAAKDSAWQSSAAQKQAQEGQYGFADRRADQVGERSDERNVDYDRKDSRYLENETGRDEAVRLAKDLAQQQVGYNNEAAATADANRNVADKKFVDSKALGAAPALGSVPVVAGAHEAYGPQDATAAALAVQGADKAKQEGSGGAIKSGFDENAAQVERGNELSGAKALSSAEAVNDYQRNKDKVAYDQYKALQDKSSGSVKQGLQDAASQGFSGNNAEAAKAAGEFDRSAAAATSNSDLAAKEKNENEALRDRDYYRKLQNDDNEVFSRRKQFFHNKKEGGNNDENLAYNRNKNARNYGAADEAELAKQNSFQNLHENAKATTALRNFEDTVDRRASSQNANEVQQAQAKGFDNQNAKDSAEALANAQGYDKGVVKSAQDDSQSSAFNRKQWLQDQEESDKTAATDSKVAAKATAADIEYVRPTNGNPLGDVSSRNLLDPGLLQGETLQKGPKEYNLPDVIVDIKPVQAPPKIVQPKHPQPLPPLPEVTQVKVYEPPKYNKQEAIYDTGAVQNRNYERPSFSRIGSLDLFRGPRVSTFEPKQTQTSKSRFNLNGLGQVGPATGAFGGRFLAGR